MNFTYAIGDAHGRFDLVCKAISMAEQHCGQKDSGTFVSCGDFVDRGPQSRQIIELFMNGPTLPNWEWVVLAGNHEDMMWVALHSVSHINWWLGNGGVQTLKSYGAVADSMMYDDIVAMVPKDHLDWLKALPVSYVDRHRAFVHAGFDPDKTLESQSREYMTWVRDEPHIDYSFMGRHVVHGHEQFSTGPILNPNKTNLDTYAWKHGRLAVAVFEDSTPGPPVEILWAEGDPA